MQYLRSIFFPYKTVHNCFHAVVGYVMIYMRFIISFCVRISLFPYGCIFCPVFHFVTIFSWGSASHCFHTVVFLLSFPFSATMFFNLYLIIPLIFNKSYILSKKRIYSNSYISTKEVCIVRLLYYKAGFCVILSISIMSFHTFTHLIISLIPIFFYPGVAIIINTFGRRCQLCESRWEIWET